MDNVIGARIKEKRVQAGYTQEELGKLFHVKKQTISKWENGINTPDVETLKELASILDCTLDYLIGNVDNPDSNLYIKDNVKLEISKEYPYELTPKQVETLIKLLKEYRLDIDSIVKDIKDGKISEEL